MNTGVGEKTRKSLYWKLSTKIVYEVFRFGISIVVARLLDPKDFGIVSIAWMVIMSSNTITSFGFNQALVQKKDITVTDIDTVFTFDLCISGGLTLLLYFAAPLIADFFNIPESEKVVRVLSMLFILTTFHDMPETIFRKELNFKIISIVEMISNFFMSIMTLIFIIAGFGYWSLVWGQIIPLAGSTLYLLYKVNWTPKIEYSHVSFKKLFNFGFWSFIRAQVNFISKRFDRFIIAKFLNPIALGLYDKAKSFCLMPAESISSNINAVLFSSFSMIQDDGEQLINMLKKSVLVTSLITFPIYAGLFSVAPYFVLVLLGEKWKLMIEPLRILALSGYAMTFTGLFATINIATGNFKAHTARLIFSNCFLVVYSVWVVRTGISAVAIGVFGYFVILFFLGFSLVRKNVQISWFNLFSYMAPALLGSVSMIVVLHLFASKILFNITFFNFLLLVFIGVLWYAFFILLFPSSVLKEVKNSFYCDLNMILNKFNKRFTKITNNRNL